MNHNKDDLWLSMEVNVPLFHKSMVTRPTADIHFVCSEINNPCTGLIRLLGFPVETVKQFFWKSMWALKGRFNVEP